MFKLTFCTVAALAALCVAAPALAGTVLLDDRFDAEHGGIGAAEYSGFANFSAANVDLLAPGYFFGLCQSAGGSTACVDMEGSGAVAAPVPEPSSWLFVSGGLALVASVARRRRRT